HHSPCPLHTPCNNITHSTQSPLSPPPPSLLLLFSPLTCHGVSFLFILLSHTSGTHRSRRPPISRNLCSVRAPLSLLVSPLTCHGVTFSSILLSLTSATPRSRRQPISRNIWSVHGPHASAT